MIEVTLAYTKDGVFTECNAKGHAGADVRGRDVVCAAVTVLIRTAMTVLNNTKGIVLNAMPSGRGEVHFNVQIADDGMRTAESAARLVCVSDFIECGVRSVMAEYPQNVRLERRIEGE